MNRTDQIKTTDELFLELEMDDDNSLSKIREKRFLELKNEINQINEMKINNHGTFEFVSSEKDILKITTSTKLCILLFLHKDFRRCLIMENHLKVF